MGQHLAATLGVPELTIFGGYISPAVPRLWRPYTDSLTDQVDFGQRGSALDEDIILRAALARFGALRERSAQPAGMKKVVIAGKEYQLPMGSLLAVEQAHAIIYEAASQASVPPAFAKFWVEVLRPWPTVVTGSSLVGSEENEQRLRRRIEEVILAWEAVKEIRVHGHDDLFLLFPAYRGAPAADGKRTLLISEAIYIGRNHISYAKGNGFPFMGALNEELKISPFSDDFAYPRQTDATTSARYQALAREASVED